MISAEERKEYQTKLQQAEEIAARYAPGTFEKESWLAIAQGYRELLECPLKAETSQEKTT